MRLPLSLKERKKIGKGYFDIEQSVLVPSTKFGDRPVSPKEMGSRVHEVRKFLSQKFGGYTSVAGIGGYYSEQRNKLIKERVVKITGFATKKAFKKYEPEVLKQLGKWSKVWGQESMGYEFEGDLYYIPKSFAEERRRRLKARLRRRR